MSELNTLINRYAENKRVMDEYKKVVDEDNKEIKSIMSKMINEDETKTSVDAGEYTATYSISISENFNEQLLLKKLHDLYGGENCPYIKTIEVPDMNAIESAIYHGDIDAIELSSCIEQKRTPRLTIKHNR